MFGVGSTDLHDGIPISTPRHLKVIVKSKKPRSPKDWGPRAQVIPGRGAGVDSADPQLLACSVCAPYWKAVLLQSYGGSLAYRLVMYRPALSNRAEYRR
jgi:hypothetical protein